MVRSINGGSGADGLTITNAVTGAAPGVPGRTVSLLTINKTTSVTVGTPTVDGHFNVNMAGGDDTLIANNMPWANGNSDTHIAFDNVNMGGGNDYAELNRAAVRNTIDMGGGNDTLKITDGFARSVAMGAGNDKLEIDSDASRVSNEELQAKAAAVNAGNNMSVDGGAGGDDTLLLGGRWTVTLTTGNVTLDTNGAAPGGSVVTNVYNYQQLSMIVGMPTLLGGAVRFPVQTLTNGTTFTPRIDFSNFEKLRVICFTAGSRIKTLSGPVAVEDLKIGDSVPTRNGVKSIQWIGKRRLDVVDLAANPKLLPVRIPAGAFGDGIPHADVLLSPQHRVVIRSSIAEKMFGATEVLAAAKQLVGTNGIAVDASIREVEYFHVMFDEHTTISVEGIEAEALYPGPEAMKSIPHNALPELFAIFPELALLTETDAIPEAHILPVLKGRDARALVARHSKNAEPLYL